MFSAKIDDLEALENSAESFELEIPDILESSFLEAIKHNLFKA